MTATETDEDEDDDHHVIFNARRIAVPDSLGRAGCRVKATDR